MLSDVDMLLHYKYAVSETLKQGYIVLLVYFSSPICLQDQQVMNTIWCEIFLTAAAVKSGGQKNERFEPAHPLTLLTTPSTIANV